jgi:hypothetical protein
MRLQVRSFAGAAGIVFVGAAGALLGARGRGRFLRWGATDDEVALRLPGDGLVPDPDLTATRAITIRVGVDAVWPWIAQLGQGRGGFYSYQRLENLIGCDIHSADRIVPEWQQLDVGDEVRLHPEVALAVALVEPGRALVLRGGVPVAGRPAPYDFSWAFVVQAEPGGGTRLLVRERYGYSRRWTGLLIEPVAVISYVMSRRMLLGIRARAERVGASTPIGADPSGAR